MSDILERDLISYDPLSEVTRKERTALLGVSTLGIAIVQIPLIPTKFSALGIDFSAVNQRTFVIIAGLVVVYYILAFMVYAFSDLVAWRRSEQIRYSEYLVAQNLRNTPSSVEAKYGVKVVSTRPNAKDNPVFKGLAAYKSGVYASRIRAIFEFCFPIVFGITALVLVAQSLARIK